MKTKKLNIKQLIVVFFLILTPISVISKGDEFNKDCNKINTNGLSLEVREWINDGVYWSDKIDTIQFYSPEDTTIYESDTISLSDQMKLWLANGTMWNSTVR